ncbi:hypothetical protein EDB89DRAFT_1903324 [Lactarius sanguifluus]|nr:hypothetical protein EDB89DRAFT_1903324 [Lactarius sanguifluus]
MAKNGHQIYPLDQEHLVVVQGKLGGKRVGMLLGIVDQKPNCSVVAIEPTVLRKGPVNVLLLERSFEDNPVKFSDLLDVGEDFFEVLDGEGLLGKGVFPRKPTGWAYNYLVSELGLEKVVVKVEEGGVKIDRDVFLFFFGVEDLIRGVEDRSIGLIWPLLPSNPMVFFKDTEEVLEIQGTGGDISCSREGRVQGQGLFRILIVLEMTVVLEDVKLSGGISQLGTTGIVSCGGFRGHLGVLGITGELSEDIWEFLAWKWGWRGRWWGCNRFWVVRVCWGFTVYAGVNKVGVWIGQGCFPGCFSPGIGEAKFFYEMDWIPVLELTDDIVLMRGNIVEPEVVSSGPKLECVGSDVREVPEEELVVAHVDYR